MAPMTPRRLRAFLARPRVAVLATIRPDGSPHLTPVWFDYQEGQALIWTSASSVKVRNLQRDPRAALCVAEGSPPYPAVILEGTVEVSTQGVEEVAYRLSVKYLGKRQGERFAREALEDGGSVVLRLTPHKVLSWDEA